MLEFVNRIIYDWVTFTSKIDSPESIVDLLGLSDCSFITLERGMNGYPNCMYFGGISICYGGREDMGVCCSMSGKGCRTFETYGNGNYKSLFDVILENYSEDVDKRKMNLTRLDVAYDDFEGILDIWTIFKATTSNGYKDNKLLQGDFVSRFNTYSVNLSNKGLSCGYGSEKSNIYIRIYDKKAEQNCEDVESWVRCEIQLRKDNAIGFIMLTGDICINYFGVLNNYLRFIKPSDTDSNKRRAETADWWAKFLQTSDRLKIFQPPSDNYDIMCLDGYVYGQCSGAVSTMIELVGIEEFLYRLNESVKGRKLNPKYKDLINQMSFKHDENSDGIIEFLRVRGAL